MKIKKLFIYLSTFIALLIAGGHINANANTKEDNNSIQNMIMSENNNSNNIIFPDASNKTEQVGYYIKSFSTKIINDKSAEKNAKKQLTDAKTDKAKKNATKRLNKVNSNLAKLNDNKVFILNSAKQDIKLAEKKVREAKTDEEHINANVSLNRSEISYSELNKELK